MGLRGRACGVCVHCPAGTRVTFHHLVYPVPEPGGRGIHLTLDLGGQARFGPDVEWVDMTDYSVDRRGHAASMQPFAVIGRHFPMAR